ncbi:thioredoxin family protein [Stratiformator vulcanicus]|uniref:Thiol:disulfide interchange protein DsbD n=1 Tax=Stratiformator vulcanicus TaxID=2527980 RepID=A0A517QW60_9PLAN|nr:thioredoxin family protein [Stratiformator vulcanicus]QDT35844.1 Thiol:disulfide interchange protein DsbD precursor [Stratiformator vulcanicus]
MATKKLFFPSAIPLSIALAVLGVGVAAHAAPPTGKIEWRTDLEGAVAEAVRTKKPLMIQVTAEWCGFCKKMLRTTYTDQDVADLVSTRFVPLVVDADEHPELMKELEIKAYPSTVIVDPRGNIVANIKGFQDAEKFHPNIARAYMRANPIAAGVGPRRN